MEILNTTLNHFFPILKYLFIIAFVADNLIIFYLVKYNIFFEHEYYNFHIRKGVKKISAIKIIFGIFIIICFISPPLTVYNFLILTILYCFYIFKMLVNFIIQK